PPRVCARAPDCGSRRGSQTSVSGSRISPGDGVAPGRRCAAPAGGILTFADVPTTPDDIRTRSVRLPRILSIHVKSSTPATRGPGRGPDLRGIVRIVTHSPEIGTDAD